MKNARILFFDYNQNWRRNIGILLLNNFSEVTICSNVDDAKAVYSNGAAGHGINNFDIVIGAARGQGDEYLISLQKKGQKVFHLSGSPNDKLPHMSKGDYDEIEFLKQLELLL
ncbi:MAG: hypothetical protein AAB657_01255 [Patescibacteria group bacterium]